MIRLREKPYKMRIVGNQGVKVKIPDKWADVQGWKPGDLIYVGYFENRITACRKRKAKMNQVGKYKIAPDRTIYIPPAIREKLDFGDNDSVAVYAENDILFYERTDA